MQALHEIKDEIVERAKDLEEYHPELVELLGETSEPVCALEALMESLRELDRRSEHERDLLREGAD